MRTFDRETNDVRLLKKAQLFASGIIRLASDILFYPIGGLTSTDVQAAIAELNTKKAATVSPVLTGTPTAPTASAGTNTTQISTTAFVQAAISALVASSPSALDTLNELAAALGNDANFATTVTNALAAKAPLTSPALTGAPTAPTAAVGTNSTQLATTAFIKTAMTLEAVSTASLEGAWANYGGGWGNAEYYKDPFGQVHLRGLIKNGAAGSVIFTLPSAYRPSVNCYFVTQTSGAGAATLWIEASTGKVWHSSGSNAYISLNGVYFRP